MKTNGPCKRYETTTNGYLACVCVCGGHTRKYCRKFNEIDIKEALYRSFIVRLSDESIFFFFETVWAIERRYINLGLKAGFFRFLFWSRTGSVQPKNVLEKFTLVCSLFFYRHNLQVLWNFVEKFYRKKAHCTFFSWVTKYFFMLLSGNFFKYTYNTVTRDKK